MENKQYTVEIIKDKNVKNDLFAKIQVVGDLEVGKSSLIERLTENKFNPEYSPTKSYELNTFLIKVNELVFKFQIWDLCGDDKYRPVLLNMYKNATLGILIYSVCSRKSYDNLENWIAQLKQYSLPGSKLFLVGNKNDDENNRQVSYEEGEMIFKKYNLDYFVEGSAKNGFKQNILEQAAICLYKENELNKENTNDKSIDLEDKGLSIMLDRNYNQRNNKKCC